MARMLSLLRPAKAKKAMQASGTQLIEDDRHYRGLYSLVDGTLLVVYYTPDKVVMPPDEEFDLLDWQAQQEAVKVLSWKIEVGQIWATREEYEAFQRDIQDRAQNPRGPRHVLDGVFERPDYVTAGLGAQRDILRRALGLTEDPPLTASGLTQIDRAKPKEPWGYDEPLRRAICCVLSEVVRREVRGAYRVEEAPQDAGIWIPWIVPEDGGERLCPAIEFVKALDEGVPSLRLLCLALTQTR